MVLGLNPWVVFTKKDQPWPNVSVMLTENNKYLGSYSTYIDIQKNILIFGASAEDLSTYGSKFKLFPLSNQMLANSWAQLLF